MLPRALAGGDDIGNLVAACVRCNLAKHDRTALEFVVQEASRCPRRPNFDPPWRSNIDPGMDADRVTVSCG